MNNQNTVTMEATIMDVKGPMNSKNNKSFMLYSSSIGDIYQFSGPNLSVGNTYTLELTRSNKGYYFNNIIDMKAGGIAPNYNVTPKNPLNLNYVSVGKDMQILMQSTFKTVADMVIALSKGATITDLEQLVDVAYDITIKVVNKFMGNNDNSTSNTVPNTPQLPSTTTPFLPNTNVSGMPVYQPINEQVEDIPLEGPATTIYNPTTNVPGAPFSNMQNAAIGTNEEIQKKLQSLINRHITPTK